jgi:thiol-disulfide isomerase/thioredoxin
MNGQTIYLDNFLWYVQASKQKSFDSTVIKGKTFEFKGKTDSSYMAFLTVGGRPLTMVFVENGIIKVEIPADDDPDKSIVSGTKLNDLFKLYNESMEPTKNKLTELQQYAVSQQDTPELELEIEEKFKAVLEEMLQVSVKFLEENPGTLLSAYILMNAISLEISTESMLDAYNKLDESVKNSVFGKLIGREVEKLKVKDLEVGEMFRDVTLKTPDDKDISISDYAGKGKYVLLDFWASWCGPCRAENPNVVALYKEYKDKGFEIVGISLDTDKDAWIKGIKDDGITWPQMSDLKRGNSEAAAKYKVRGIPFTVLLDKDGKVLETGLRGQALKDKLKALIP